MDSSRARAGLAALRPHQWAKNLLLFAPLVLSPVDYHDIGVWITVAWAFVAFSAVASAGYVLNDLLDLEADRSHPTKRERPFASGMLSTQTGGILGAGLLGLGFGVAVQATTPSFVALLVAYFALTCIYSLLLKRLLLFDVFMLAGLYVLRVLAGGAAAGIAATPWLLAFSLFLFLGLAFAKRYSELRWVVESGAALPMRRAYQREDLDLILILGTVSTYLSVLIFCLYVNSDQVTKQYRSVAMLWWLAPMLLYWVTRLWFLARRGELSGDPVAFAVRDRTSLLTGALMACVLWWAAR